MDTLWRFHMYYETSEYGTKWSEGKFYYHEWIRPDRGVPIPPEPAHPLIPPWDPWVGAWDSH